MIKKRPYERRKVQTTGSSTVRRIILPGRFVSLAWKYKARRKKCLFCKKPIYMRPANTLYHKKCRSKAYHRRKLAKEGKIPTYRGTRRLGL